MLQIAILSLFPLLMAFAALSDLFTMTISNRVSLILIVSFVPIALAAGFTGPQLALHIVCGIGMLVLTFSLFAFGFIGGGDAKLAAATAIWMGTERLLEYGLYASVFGGALTLALLYVRKSPLPRFALGVDWVERLHTKGAGVPYGIALAASGLLLYPETHVWIAAVLA